MSFENGVFVPRQDEERGDRDRDREQGRRSRGQGHQGSRRGHGHNSHQRGGGRTQRGRGRDSQDFWMRNRDIGSVENWRDGPGPRSSPTPSRNQRGRGGTNRRTFNNNNTTPPNQNQEQPFAFRLNPDAASFVPHQSFAGPPGSDCDGGYYNEGDEIYDTSSEEEDSASYGNGKGATVQGNHMAGAGVMPRRPDVRNQRERLSDQLSRNACDCMICVERVRRNQGIWTCSKCYNIFHLRCVTTWAQSSKDEVGWRCPGCQSYFETIPNEYRCFCGKQKNPNITVNASTDTPHTCGQICGKMEHCYLKLHPCLIPCHPGPCPPCEAIEKRKCCCGKTSAQVKCSSKAVITCGKVCDKFLNCKQHRCVKLCHHGDCDPCAVIQDISCFCNKESKQQLCDFPQISGYTCGKPCSKLLKCDHHSCKEVCHPGPCAECVLSPIVMTTCPCGQTPISEACKMCGIAQRRSCLDKVPVCNKICGRELPCGKRSKAGEEHHKCSTKCHQGSCPKCPLSSSLKCRCGSKTFELLCTDFEPEKVYRCEKQCGKKQNCGRHKCKIKCCTETEHICMIVCNRSLRCGHHSCSLLCHNGHCPPCRVYSFDELRCECESAVIYPPVACGTKPPPCTQPCSRSHDCDHEVLHNCHSEPQCPPCTVLTKKWCHGGHMERSSIMCYIKDVSCGMQCSKPLPCKKHTCIKLCHPKPCLAPGEKCKLPCDNPRGCGHSCGLPCHGIEACPADSKCRIQTETTCPCGRRQETMLCYRREVEYDRLVTYLMNLEIKKLKEANEKAGDGEVVEINADNILDTMKVETPKSNVLECDKECARVERNRKMMEALKVEDPDATSTFGTPNYTEFLRTFTKKNPQFVENIHDRLTNLVVKAKRSKRKNETYGFESMNRDKRRVIHEYAEHFGCLSESFDEEPNRNVICTASKDKSFLPSVSLVDAVFRPNMCSERKNAHNDVEIFQNSKSQIIRPANGKIVPSPRTSTSKLVPLTSTLADAGSSFSQYHGPPASSTNGRFPSNRRHIPTSSASVVLGADFPPLS